MQHSPTGLCNGGTVFSVKYELNLYVYRNEARSTRSPGHSGARGDI